MFRLKHTWVTWAWHRSVRTFTRAVWSSQTTSSGVFPRVRSSGDPMSATIDSRWHNENSQSGKAAGHFQRLLWKGLCKVIYLDVCFFPYYPSYTDYNYFTCVFLIGFATPGTLPPVEYCSFGVFTFGSYHHWIKLVTFKGKSTGKPYMS